MTVEDDKPSRQEYAPGHTDVAGRRVVITGAGRGLGSVLAAAFDAAGARLRSSRGRSPPWRASPAVAGDHLVCAATCGTSCSTRPSPSG